MPRVRSLLPFVGAMVATAAIAGVASAWPNQWSPQTPWLCTESCTLYSAPTTPTSTVASPCDDWIYMWMSDEWVSLHCDLP